MDFPEVIRKRVMVRGYTDEPVSDDALARILRAAHRAPSAGFSQGHRLVIVTDADLRRQAAKISEGRYTELGFSPWISQAPMHIYLCIREGSYHERYGDTGAGSEEIGWPVPFWWFDCGAMFMLIQLAAISEQLATGFFSAVDRGELDALSRVAGLAEDVSLAGVITIGHPDHDRPVPAISGAPSRRPVDDIVEWRR
jgi:FMN reductase [NAD(P)H]